MTVVTLDRFPVDMDTMRTPLLLAAVVLLVTACGKGRPTGIEPTTAIPPAVPVVLTWDGDGTSSGVHVKVGRPVAVGEPVIGVDGKPDPAFRFVEVPVTADNKTDEKARLSFSGRVGTKEVLWKANNSVTEAPAAETTTTTARFRVPVDAEDLTVEVHANVSGAVTTNRLTFKGPLT
ncbi:hypothetical protein ACFFQW_45390 [Umezawaea endophytica]|uniref:Uncharacterized protein n=1 Tax=Umezawaea endophytica TaxID=1654476 RepID=A0A9X3AHX7_9PSEU|nr:hypothetical protein [Umezawaea endophytica]MCS7481726.1 hypothetical protein [Umezawaea endophytica]